MSKVCKLYEDNAILSSKHMTFIDIPITQRYTCHSQATQTRFPCVKGKILLKNISLSWITVGSIYCGENNASTVFFKISFENGPPTTQLDRYLSLDQQRLPEMLTAFVLIYIFLIAFALYTLGRLREIRMLHTTALVFFIGIIFRAISLTVQMLGWWLLVISDEKPPALDMLGAVFSLAANFIFICNALSIAFGYTIVCGHFNFEVCNLYGGFLLVYIVGSGALGVLDSWTTDADRFFVYGAGAGLGFFFLRLFGWSVTLAACLFTVFHHRRKIRFYSVFMPTISVWYLTLPLTVLLVKSCIIDYDRARIVYAVELFLDLFASVAILLFIQPRVWNKFFPYHLSVNRVDVVTFDEAIRFPPPPGFQTLHRRALAGAAGQGVRRESIRRQMSTTTHLDISDAD